MPKKRLPVACKVWIIFGCFGTLFHVLLTIFVAVQISFHRSGCKMFVQNATTKVGRTMGYRIITVFGSH